MKKRILIPLIICLGLSPAFCYIDNPGFQQLLEKAQLTFTKPDGFTEVAVVKNRQMNYDYAMYDTTKGIEVRYTIRPIDTTDTKMDFDKKSTMGVIFSSILFNISDQKKQTPELMKTLKVFPAEAVQRDFHATDGIFTKVSYGTEFGQDYKYGIFLNLHKSKVAHAYVYFLAKDSIALTRLNPAIFYALKFK